MTVSRAKQIIDRMAATRPDCESCDMMSYHTVYEGVSAASGGKATQEQVATRMQQLFDEGWGPLTDRAGIVKRCATCASTPKYPWAEKLDAERVAKWINDKREVSGGSVIDLPGLKELVEP